MKIVVYSDYLPIPIRTMDWQAFDEDRIDGAPDAGIQAQRVGYGRTRDEALQELSEIACDDYTEDELTQGDESALQRCDVTTMVFVALVRGVGVTS
jgi:hypothetical protein